MGDTPQHVERSHDDADPCTGTANPPCVDGCVWSLEMSCSVLSGAIVAVTAMASLSLMESYTAPGEYPPSGAPIHHLGLCPWGLQWRGSLVVIHCDNMGAVAVMNTGSSKVSHIMYLLRCLFFIRARLTLSVRAVHVREVQNGWADAISAACCLISSPRCQGPSADVSPSHPACWTFLWDNNWTGPPPLPGHNCSNVVFCQSSDFKACGLPHGEQAVPAVLCNLPDCLALPSHRG